MKTTRVGAAGALAMGEKSRRSAGPSDPLLGLADGGQGRLEHRRILLLGEVRPLGHDEVAGADAGVRLRRSASASRRLR